MSRTWVSAWLATVGILLLAGAVSHVRHAGRTAAGVRYGSAGGQDLLLDIYRPRGKGPHPGVLLIHGGGWQQGSRAELAQLGDYLAKEGFVAFSVDYRLTTPTGNRWPAQLEDAQRAVRWVRAHSTEYDVDPERLGAFGGSAGGHLAALLGECDTRGRSDDDLAGYSSRVQCVVDTSGPADFMDTNWPLPLVQNMILRLFGKSREEAPELYRDASPVNHADARSAPTLIFHGTEDTLVPIEQSERLYAALRKAGVEVRLIRMEGEGHGFAKPEHVKQWLEESVAFLKAHLQHDH